MEDLPSAQKQQHISTKMDLGSRKSSTVAAKSSTNDSMLPHKASILTSGNSSKMLSASTVGNHRKGSLTPSDRKATSAAAAGLVSSSSGVAPSSRNRRPSDRRMSLSRLKVESSAASEKTAYSALLSPPASPDNDPLLDAPLPRRKSVYEPVHPPNPSGLAAAAAARKNSAPSLLRDTNRSSRNTSAASSIRSVAASLHNKDRSSKKGGADAAADEEVHKSSTSSHSRRLSEASGLTRRNAINRSNLSSGIRQKLSDPNLSKRRGSSNQLWSSMNSVSSSNSSLHQERKVRTLERINQALKHKKRHSRKRTDSDSKATSERGSERGVGEGGGAAAKEHQPDVEHAQSLKAIVAKSSKTSTALEVPTSKKIGLKNLDSFEELLSDLYPGDAAEEEKSKGKSNVVKKEEVEEEKRKNTVSKEPRIPSTATLKTSSTPALDDLPVPAILSASNPQLSRSNPDMPTDEPPPDASFNMAPCPICERTFKEDRLASHQKICNKVTKKAEVRAAKRESKEAAEEKKKKAESKGKKKDYEIVKTNNWRAKHGKSC